MLAIRGLYIVSETRGGGVGGRWKTETSVLIAERSRRVALINWYMNAIRDILGVLESRNGELRWIILI